MRSSAELPSRSPDGGEALTVAQPNLGWNHELKNLQHAEGAGVHHVFPRYEEIDFKVVVGQMPLVNMIINKSRGLKAILPQSPVARTDHLVSVSGYKRFLGSGKTEVTRGRCIRLSNFPNLDAFHWAAGLLPVC